MTRWLAVVVVALLGCGMDRAVQPRGDAGFVGDGGRNCSSCVVECGTDLFPRCVPRTGSAGCSYCFAACDSSGTLGDCSVSTGLPICIGGGAPTCR